MSLISAIFGTVFALHHPAHHHYHHRVPIVVRTVPVLSAGVKAGPPIIVAVREDPTPLPFPAGTSYEVDNIGEASVHLTGEITRDLAGHTGIFVRREYIEAATDPGSVSFLQVWGIH